MKVNAYRHTRTVLDAFRRRWPGLRRLHVDVFASLYTSLKNSVEIPRTKREPLSFHR
jgi:hypothetical protein